MGRVHNVNKTLVLCKPDAVERGLVGAIVSRFEARGLRIVALRMLTITHELAARHYAEHVDRPFYTDLQTFIGRSPAVAMVIEGPEDTYAVVRSMMGQTNPLESAPGTIRGDYGLEMTENLVHGSDSNASAEREIGIFFPDLCVDS
ncbi:MAG: nucleoside-diphosphate kinase [Acidimicrobiia bacterium]|nr:nucleoside-diphosphate kinase [Acidimicrobiia bacterium]MYC58110.1 nucleoside-diphosphate kinase [Acidimicrobiia bacterium]MYG94400.1 nucleoside-diphosphate kinase [Acidimicrobiia bacterium]MYI30542.1 nucleoside-diphosphate kinase [Acidimicrobiia bacterium]